LTRWAKNRARWSCAALCFSDNMDQTRNPYITNSGQPLLTTSVVAFVDILGYKDLINDSPENSQETLNKIHNALHQSHSSIDPKRYLIKPLGKKDRYALRAFTDNVVIGYPIGGRGDAEVELGSIFDHLSYFQMALTMKGFFIRGAISIGGFYMDDLIVFGDGLIEAYKGEKFFARDPRIILTESALNSVKQHLTFYGNKSRAPQVRNLLKDTDGQFFVNYLTTLYPEEGYLYLEELSTHKKVIEDKLSNYIGNPVIWYKYFWSANYHNYWCKEQKQVDDNYIIDLSQYNLSPALIVDTT
jgi:hypothetical protein